MTIERLMEAIWRLSRGPNAKIRNIHVTVTDDFFHIAQGGGNASYKYRRRCSIFILGPGQDGWQHIGGLDIDINGIVLSAEYNETAPWWAVQPIADALAGK